MTEKQFVMWLKGFTEACHHLAPTPAQWDKIIETLKTVKEESNSSRCSKTYSYPYNSITNSDVNTVATTDNFKTQLND
jgi:hypothetical protein